MSNESTRRTFIKGSAAAVAGTALTGSLMKNAHAAGSDEIKFVLVGCGGRGKGAAAQIMNTKGNTKLVAVADAFVNRTAAAVKGLKGQYKDKVDVPEDRIFVGLDAYKHAIDVDCDLVVIATPPGFKPQQIDYAVQKGRHVFTEKPVATDAPGVRRVLAATEEAKKKNLMLTVGLQRRHEQKYIETVQRLQDGAIGDILCQRVYWNSPGIWHRGRQPNESEMAHQVNNWYHFIWLCGDQICEQHIHNIDIACWVKGAYPVECNGMGGRERRLDGDRTKSQIFDHTFCEFTFADGSKMFSQGRHLEGGWTSIGEFAHGTKGTASPAGWIKGEQEWRFKGKSPGGTQQEQHDLIEGLMTGNIYNEGEYGAKSTFATILGREACYSGKVLKWDELLERGKDYCPGIDNYTMDATPPTVPDAEGKYPVPVPGIYDPFVRAAETA